jgi:GTPase SAR1 family protein
MIFIGTFKHFRQTGIILFDNYILLNSFKCKFFWKPKKSEMFDDVTYFLCFTFMKDV